ncbi:transporter substrate-binding domain-containing protein [Rhizobium sp. 18055]|uniref:transporter substrate-binding domain-containing protein n=1 Tax=Rhizobium sp. 18055 TaxID=2681403 RepID=UPI0027B9E6C2|nr:transporter substrate-binding domain-containing protein [Rhizobium sp. 18055]
MQGHYQGGDMLSGCYCNVLLRRTILLHHDALTWWEIAMRGRKSALYFIAAFFLVCLNILGSTFDPAMARDQLIKARTGDFDAMQKRRLVRVIVPFSKTLYFVDRGRAYGTAVDLGNELERVLNKDRTKEIKRIRIAFIPVQRDSLLSSLNAGFGDMVMANLTITPSRLKQVDFTDPLYDGASEVLVTGPSTPSTPIISPEDLGGKEVFVRHQPKDIERTRSEHEEIDDDEGDK